jgi:hypothetical protein
MLSRCIKRRAVQCGSRVLRSLARYSLDARLDDIDCSRRPRLITRDFQNGFVGRWYTILPHARGQRRAANAGIRSA